jgi:hypothetical protein
MVSPEATYMVSPEATGSHVMYGVPSHDAWEIFVPLPIGG